MDRGSWHCTEEKDQDHPQEKEMQKGKMVVWGGPTNSCKKKRSEKQRRKVKIHTHPHTYADVADVLFSDYIDAEAPSESHCIWMSLKGTVIILLPHLQFLDNFSQ